MPKMKGGRAVVEALIAEGVEVVFGIPGVHTLEIYDALYDHPEVRHIVTRHEQGAAFMADGYARASGKVGVVLTITGPGTTNAATGLGEAYADGVPLLLITSEVASNSRGKGNLHELKDQMGMLSSITLWSAEARSVPAIPGLIHEAMERIGSGWPGPVHIQIPIDILSAEGEVEVGKPSPPAGSAAKPDLGTPRSRRLRGDPDDIARAAELLQGAERPLLYAGWGVTATGANSELEELAERLQAPVLTDSVGKGAIPEDHPLSLGATWRERGAISQVVEQADLGLAVGTRLGGMETRGWSLPMPKRLIHIDPEEEIIGRSYPTELGLVGHPKELLCRLLAQLDPLQRPSRAQEVAAVKREAEQELEARSPQMRKLIADLRAAMPREAILSLDIAVPSYWATTYFPVYEPRTFLSPHYFMTLGYGLPAGIGAKIACPERPVVVICGDGGFMFTCQELATAVKYGLDMAIVLFNNDGYGAIRRNQERRYGGRIIGADLTNPDFVKFAEAFGVKGVRLPSLEELGPALREALKARELRLIEVPIHSLNPPW